ncbi:hypothetical protein [Halorubellus litoreus]|uniref:Uncharacterized protein n=1 Tax=Halorubellus litoreus TaxID=755308 RepID=A0ABD5VIK5_9EURY
MRCDSIRAHLNFEVSGIIVKPYELSVDTEYGKLDHCRATVSEEAGLLIENSAEEWEPVTVTAGDAILGRFTLPPDTIEHDVGDGNEAFVNLYDQRKILTRGFVEKRMHNHTLGEIMEYILDQRNDPHEVIKGVRYVDAGDIETVTIGKAVLDDRDPGEIDADDDLRDGITYVGSENRDWLESIQHLLRDFSDKVFLESSALWGVNGGFTFDHVTPWRAIEAVQKRFGFEVHVNRFGYLELGTPDADGTTYLAGTHPSLLTVTNYNVPEDPTPVRTAVVVGGVKNHAKSTDFTQQFSPTGVGFSRREVDRYRFYARATRGDVNAGDESIIVDVRDHKELARRLDERQDHEDGRLSDWSGATDGVVLEEIARRVLQNAIRAESSGSITLNGLSSTEISGDLRAVTVGQKLVVEPSGNRCKRTIDGGVFEITAAQHSMSPHDGWRVTLQLSRLPMYFDDQGRPHLIPMETETFLVGPNGNEYDPQDIFG